MRVPSIEGWLKQTKGSFAADNIDRSYDEKVQSYPLSLVSLPIKIRYFFIYIFI